MPKETHRSAAVPFINEKGERSMKRVKVARYVAGERPAYAKEEDDEEEYITDDEEQDQEEEEEEDEEYSSENEHEPGPSKRTLPQNDAVSDDDDDDDEGVDDEDDEDPRFRRLKQVENKIVTIQQIQPSSSVRTVVFEDEDDDDGEEEVRRRHKLARKRQLEEPLGPQAILGNATGADQWQPDEDEEEELSKQTKRVDTDDILKDLVITGIRRPVREESDSVNDGDNDDYDDDYYQEEDEEDSDGREQRRRLEEEREHLEELKSQTYKKVEEDIRREAEREALAKGDIGAREMSSVVTDDEDEELAYEEWKIREIKRVQRDRCERMLRTTRAR